MTPEPTDEHREAAKKIMIFLDRGANPDLDWVAFFLAQRDAEKDRVIAELRADIVNRESDYRGLFSRAEEYLESAANYEMAWFAEKQRAEKEEVLTAALRTQINTLETDGGIWDKSVYRERAARAESLVAELRTQLSSDAKLERQIAIEYELVTHMGELLDEQQRICATHDKSKWPGLIRMAEEQQNRAEQAEAALAALKQEAAEYCGEEAQGTIEKLREELAERTKERDAYRENWVKEAERHQNARKTIGELSKLREPVGDEEVREALSRLRGNAWRWSEKTRAYERVDDDALIVENALRAKTAELKQSKRVERQVACEYELLAGMEAEVTAKTAALKEAEARCLKHVGHEHCVTPCDSIRIQDENHSAWLVMKDRAEAAEAKLAAVRSVVDDMGPNECTCGADDGDDFGSGGQETGCYKHELLAALEKKL